MAGTHLPTLEGWKKAELASVAGYVMRQFTYPTAVIHPTTNRVTPYVHSNLAFGLVGAFTKFDEVKRLCHVYTVCLGLSVCRLCVSM